MKKVNTPSGVSMHSILYPDRMKRIIDIRYSSADLPRTLAAEAVPLQASSFKLVKN